MMSLSRKKLLTSNHAVAEAVKIAKPDVVAAYPITPQSPITERLAEMIASGELNASFIRVESEHSALAAVFGAATAGSRVFTATSSHGLVYMYEMCWWAAGSRVPLVMAVATRSIGAPWNIHNDHTDIMCLRDVGWIISMSENAQEAFDLTIQGFIISETANLPVAIGLDAFSMSHTAEVVEVRDVEIPPRSQAYTVVPGDAFAVNAVTMGKARMKARFDQSIDLEDSARIIEEVDRNYPVSYGGLVEEYRLDDAEYIVVMAGGWCGDAKDAIDILREEGIEIGMLRLRYIRPFPVKQVENLDGKILVVDRANSGMRGVLGIEVASCGKDIHNVVAGIGGMDVGVDDFVEMFKRFVDGELKKVEWWYR
jgi:pyruvate ferredoxin oxidoreductase alpha subunit